MNIPSLTEIKTYIYNNRPNAEQILNKSDTELNRYINLAYNLLITYYDFSSYTGTGINIISEQMIHLMHNNIDFSLLEQYNGLTSFNIGGSIQGSVKSQVEISLFSTIVKALLLNEGIEEKINLNNKVLNAYTAY